MNKYKDWDKKDLIEHIKILEKKKKFGLTWEHKNDEGTVLFCKENLIVLEEDIKKRIVSKKSNNFNLFIEGDNYYSLAALNYSFEKKIDFIYIDPPYNTGGDWKYTNDYINRDDPYIHTKWLSFMYERLRLAKDLLKDDGIICVTIDNHEAPRLWLLLDEMFGSNNFLGEVIIRNNPASRNVDGKIALTHEFAFFYGKSLKSKIAKLPVHPKDKTHKYLQDPNGIWYAPTNLRKTGVDNFGVKKDGSIHHRHYPIYVDPKTKEISTSKKFKIVIYPVNEDGEKVIWRRAKEDIEEMYKKEEIWYNKTSFGDQIYYKFYGGTDGESPKSIWIEPEFSASEHGTPSLNNVLGKKSSFPFPKSPFAVERCVEIGCPNKDGIVLDFFAGSGTTAHAVMNLNLKKQKNLKFIVCTNNENSIADEDTYPRIRNVIKGGYEDRKGNKVEGYDTNLNYYKISSIKKTNTDQDKIKLSKRLDEMIMMKENTYNVVLEEKNYKIFNLEDKYTIIIYNVAVFDKVKEKLKKINGKIKIYIFSLSNENFNEEFEEFPNIITESFPGTLLSMYKRLFINL